MKKTVLLHLDALSRQYLTDAWLPRTSAFMNEIGCCDLWTGLSYEGITASMMTGVTPAEHGVWTHFYLADEVPTRSVRIISRLPEQLNRSHHCQSYGTANGIPARLAAKAFRYLGAELPLWRYHFVPLKWIPRFGFSLPRYDAITEYDDFGGHQTLAGLARAAGLRCADMFGTWGSVVTDLERLLETKDFVFVHTMMELDKLGHEYGPASDEVRGFLRTIDGQLLSLIQQLQKTVGRTGQLIVFSDHGMTPITRTIDAKPLLRRALSEHGTVAFIDSTMVRVWTDPKRLVDWHEFLDSCPGLQVLTADSMARLPKERAVIGDVAAVAEVGALLLPNFWQGDRRIKGMHGYMTRDDWQTAFLTTVPDGMGPGELSAEDVFDLAARTLAN